MYLNVIVSALLQHTLEQFMLPLQIQKITTSF